MEKSRKSHAAWYILTYRHFFLKYQQILPPHLKFQQEDIEINGQTDTKEANILLHHLFFYIVLSW